MFKDDRQLLILENHLRDLTAKSIQRFVPVHTDFLTLYEQDALKPVMNQLQTSGQCQLHFSGGYTGSERKIIEIIPVGVSDTNLTPICILKVTVCASKKFVTHKLTHRDYLGSILALGIERNCIGDLLILDEDSCYIICLPKLAPYIKDNLTMVRNVKVQVDGPIELTDFNYKPAYEEITGSANSERLDAVIALAFHRSRTSMTGEIEKENVFVNGQMINSCSYILKPEQIVSVRGQGKFIYAGIIGNTKKNHLLIKILKYC